MKIKHKSPLLALEPSVFSESRANWFSGLGMLRLTLSGCLACRWHIRGASHLLQLCESIPIINLFSYAYIYPTGSVSLENTATTSMLHYVISHVRLHFPSRFLLSWGETICSLFLPFATTVGIVLTTQQV